MKKLREILLEAYKDEKIYYHGSASGDLRGGSSGLHIGTHKAAKQALEASIGHPATGSWDGKREYGKTKLAGKFTQKQHILNGSYDYSSGHNCDAPEHDYYPHEHPIQPEHHYPDGSKMPMNVKPNIQKFKITGPMSNSPQTPHKDFHANGYMKANIKKNKLKNGFYYKNDAEDAGSISAVVPNGKHLTKID